MPAKVGPSSPAINRASTNYSTRSAQRRHAAKIIRQRYSSATTHTVPGRALTVWQTPAAWSNSSTTSPPARARRRQRYPTNDQTTLDNAHLVGCRLHDGTDEPGPG